MKKRVIFVGKDQFGYQTDLYKYCEHLRDLFDITVVCFERNLPEIALPGINVITVPNHGFLAKYRAIHKTLKSLSETTPGAVFIQYMPFCAAFPKLFPNAKVILDFRTAGVQPNAIKRMVQNNLSRLESCWFKHHTVINPGVARKLGIKHYSLLPLGADVFSAEPKLHDKMRLLYVGTLVNRKIERTIEGLARFNTLHHNCVESYDIVGTGSEKDVQKLIKEIKRYNLGHIVKLHGYVPQTHLKPFFDSANAGITFVPIKPWYMHQPPTKALEYAASGLRGILTATEANVELYNTGIGDVLCLDTAKSFASALQTMYTRFNQKQPKRITVTSWADVSEMVRALVG